MFVNFITSFNNSVFGNVLDIVLNTIIKDWGSKYEIIELHQVLPNGRTKLITIY